MTTNEIIKLAEKDGTKTKLELESKLAELKSQNWKILECIIYVKTNQKCSLSEGMEIVVNSAAWLDKKDDFLQHQEEQMTEFLESAVDDIDKIEDTYYPDRTERKITLKSESKSFKNWFKKKN